MTEENVFGDQTKEEGKVENQDSNSGSSSLFVIGERAYDVEAARKKIESADEHIRRIEEENAKMRDELNKAKTLEDVIAAMKPNTTSEEPKTPATNTEDVASLVERMLVETRRKEKAAANLEVADKEMKKIYGEKAKDMVIAKAEELGLGIKTITDIAAQSPAAFMQLFKSQQSESVESSNKGTQSSTAMPDGSIKEGTYAYYQKIRKENPALYNSPAVQQKMVEDADRLGREAFFS